MLIPGPLTYLKALSDWMLLLLSPILIVAWLLWMMVALTWLLIKWLIVVPSLYGHRKLKERRSEDQVLRSALTRNTESE